MILGRKLVALRSPVFGCVWLAALVVVLTTGPALAQTTKGGAQGAKQEDNKEKAGKKKEDPKPVADKKTDRTGDKKKEADKDPEKPSMRTDPELQGKIDKVLEDRAKDRKEEERKSRAARRRQHAPRTDNDLPSRPGRSRTDRPGRGEQEELPGDSTTLNIPAVEGVESDIPPEEREYEFSIKDATYEQLIEGIARQTGLGVVGEAPKEGKVSFVTTEKLNFDQLMDRVRTLLFNYKDLDPYTIIRRKDYLEVVRVVDYLRDMPFDRMFRSVEDFLVADLPDSELALVIYTPKSGSVADLKELRNFLPDYVRIAPLAGQNRVTIFALVSDIKKYLDLIDFFPSDIDDPRTLEKIEVEHILPSVAIAKLQQLMDLSAGSRPSSKGRKGRSTGVSPLDTMPEPEVTLVPEDAQGVIIVRAMQDKIAEIRKLLPLIDVDTTSQLDPVIIELQHADPEVLIATIQQVLAASEGSAALSESLKKPRTKKKRSAASTAVSADDVVLLPHPAGNAIVVLGDEDGVTRVRALVAKFDVAGTIGPLELPLEHADASDVAATVAQVMAPDTKAKGKKPRGGSLGFGLVPAPSGDALWFTGSEKDLATLRDLIARLDVAEDPVSLYVTELRYRKPSFVVSMLQELERGTGSEKAAGRPKTKKRSGGKRAPAISKFTPMDEEKRLYVLCTEKEWEEYLPFIEELDVPVGDEEPFHPIELKHIQPGEAIAHLETLMDVADDANVEYVEAPFGLIVIGATPAQLEDMRALLAQVDVASDLEQRTFEIQHADPAEIVTLIETFVADEGPQLSKSTRRTGAKPRKKDRAARAVSSQTLSVVQVDHRLVVRATPAKMEKVAELIAEFDVPDDDPAFVKFTLAHKSAEEARGQLDRMFGGAAGPKKEKGIKYAPVEDGLLVAGASKSQLEDIKTLLAEIDCPSRLQQRTFVIQHTDPADMITLIQTLVTGESAPRTPRPRGKAEGRKGATPPAISSQTLSVVQVDDRLVVRATPEKMEEVAQVIDDFDVPDDEPPFVRIDVTHIRPEQAIEKLDYMLGGAEGAKREERIRYAPAKGSILVVGAEKSKLDDIRVILAEIDRPTEIQERTFVIQHADPAELMDLIETLISDTAGAPKRKVPKRRGKEGPLQQVSESEELRMALMGNRLVVKATEAKMQRVAELVETFDIEAKTTELKVYEDFPPGADIDSIANTLAQAFGGEQVSKSRQKARPKVATGPKFIPQSAVGKLVVLAEPAMFAEIEELLVVLRVGIDVEQPEFAFVDLQYADPEDVVERIEPLLNIKVRTLVEAGELADTLLEGDAPGKPRSKGGRPRAAPGRQAFHLEPDVRNRRVVIAAPQIVIDEAIALIADFDKPSQVQDRIFRTVELQNTDADEMVAAIKEMMGTSSRRGVPKGPKGRKVVVDESEATLTVTTAPGGGAVLLRGTPDDVEEATEWIKQLDAEAIAGGMIKVYEIEHADIELLVDIIMNRVDIPARTPKGKQAPRRPKRQEPPPEEEMFTTTLTRVGSEVYIHADLITKTMLVAASQAKLTQIDAIVAQLDSPGEGPGPITAGTKMPRQIFDLKWADSFDASFDLEMVFGALWEPADQLPQVEEAPFGNALIVIYPYEDRFSEIEELIVKYVDVRPEPEPPVRKAFAPPPGLSAEEAAQWLALKHPELNIKLVNVTKGKADEDYGVEQLKPPKASEANPCVLPTAFHRAVAGLVASATALDQEQDASNEKTPKADTDEDTEAQPAGVDALLSRKANRLLGEVSDRSQENADREAGSQVEFDQVEILYDERENVLVIRGLEDVIDDMEDSLDEMKEEIERLGVAPDIRIYRVKYIDIYTAQDILEEMYNTPRRQRADIRRLQQQQQQQQQRLRQQQMQQRQQQQQQGKGAPGEEGRPGQPPGRRGQQQGNVPQQIPQIPQATVRVYPNPRDRTLILRADTSQYPAILELLATIDRPRPVESTFRIFELKKLNAGEVEELLESMLGIGQATSRRRTTGAPGRQPTAAPQGGQLPEQIMQETDTASGALGVDPKDINISSNPEANTIIVMAPPAALDYIEKLIEQLESHETPERITKHYQLEYADAQEAADYLSTHFEEGPSTTRGRGGKKSPKASTGQRALNAPTFIAYPRLNLLSAQATEEQIGEVDDLIARLDIKGDTDEWVTVELAHADAGVVANTLSTMFAGGATPTRRKGRTATATGLGPKFVGEDGEKILFFSASKNLHERIHEVITQLEEQSKVVATPRIIELQYATPSTVAEAIESAYGGGSRRGGTKRGTPAAPSARFTVAAHDPSKRLFVVADDELFREIESLARSLDTPASIGFEFKIYRLEHADARKVYEQMSKLIADYLRALGRDRGNVEPFSVEVDEKANALIVLGSKTVFDFLDENLANIDIPANAPSPPAFLMVALKNANAQEVAQNINRLWSQRNLPRGETAPQVEANRTLNMLIVRGTQEQIDEIKKEFIDPLEEHTPPKLLTETITLAHAQPEAVAESINRIFEDRRLASQTLGRGSNISPLEFTVVVTPDVDTRQLIVQASEENMEFVKTRVVELDKKEIGAGSATSMQIYPVKYADPNAVMNIINQWARSRTMGGGRQRALAARDAVVAVAEQATQSVVVTANASNHIIIQELIDGLDSEELATGQRKRHVIQLEYANSNEVANQFTQVFRQGVRRRRGDPGPAFTSDPKTNCLIASVDDEELAEVNELLAALDVEPRLDAIRVTKPYPLKYADPGSLNGVIQNMFRWDRRSQGSPSEQVTSAVEWATQSVVVTASEKNHEVIRTLIEQVDKESTFKKKTQIVKLANANAEDVANTLNQVLRSRRSTRRGEQPISISPDAGTNALIIQASDADMDELDPLIASLDLKPEAQRQRQLKSIKLTYANPWSVQDAINRLFRGISRNPRDQVTAVPEFGANAVIVSASPENMERVEELIAQLDSADTNLRQVEVINIEHADPSSVARALDQIFVRSVPRSRGGEQPISISEIQGSKAILVKASAADMERIQETIAELDSETFQPGSEVRVVALVKTDATEMQTVMQESLAKTGGGGRRGRAGELVGDVRLSVLTQANAIVISGDLEEVDKLEARIRQLDQAAGEASTGTEIITLKYVSVGQVLPTVQAMYGEEQRGRGRGRSQLPPPIIESLDAINALVVKASPTDLLAIKETVAQLDTEDAAAVTPYRIIKVASGVNLEEFARDIEETVNEGAAAQAPGGGSGRRGRRGTTRVPSIIITPNLRTRTLMVSGSPTLFDQAEALVSLLEDIGPGGEPAVTIMRTKNMTIDDVNRLVEQLKGDSSGSGKQGRSSSSSRRPRSTGRGK